MFNAIRSLLFGRSLATVLPGQYIKHFSYNPSKPDLKRVGFICVEVRATDLGRLVTGFNGQEYRSFYAPKVDGPTAKAEKKRGLSYRGKLA